MTAVDTVEAMQSAAGPTGRKIDWLRRHGGPLALFVILSGFWAVVSWPKGVEYCTSDLWIYFGMVLKAEHADLFTRDLLFGNPANYAEWPLFTAYLRVFYRLTGDVTFGLKTLTFPLNLLFMVGAYFACLELNRARWSSALLASLASLPISIPASAEIFGVGPATVLVPRTVFTAVFPWVWYGYVRSMTGSKPWLLDMVFLAAGLLANIHGISAFLLVQILLVLTLFRLGLGLRPLLRCLRLGLFATVGALPMILAVLARPATPGETAPVEALLKIFQLRNPYLYPQPMLLGHMPAGILHAATAVLIVSIPLGVALWERRGTDRIGLWCYGLAILALWYMVYSPSTLFPLTWVSAAFLLSRGRPLGQPERLTIYLGLAVFLVGVGGVLILKGLYLGFGVPPFGALHQFRAIRFSGFVVFLLAAMGAAWLGVRWRDLRDPWRAAVLLLSVLTVGMLAREAYRTHVWIRRDAARDSLVRVASWARANTSQDALFLVDSPLFRILARRSLVASTKDMGMHFMLRRNVLEANRRVEEQRAAIGSIPALMQLASKYRADYVIVPRRGSVTAISQTVVYQDPSYLVLTCQPDGCT